MRRNERVLVHGEATGTAHDAFLVLTLDVLRGLKQPLHRVHELHLRARVEDGTAARWWSKVLRQTLTVPLELLERHVRGCRAGEVRHELVGNGERIALNPRGELRHRGIENAL